MPRCCRCYPVCLPSSTLTSTLPIDAFFYFLFFCLSNPFSPKTLVHQYWQAGSRPDGRPWAAVRRTTIATNVFPHTTASSVLVQQGATQIAAALNWQIGQQTTSTVEQQGDVWVQVVDSQAPQAQRAGTANYTALQSWLQRTLYDTLDLSQLSIRPGLGWRAAIVVHILHADGAVRDASWLAAVAVLRLARIPIVTDKWPLGDGQKLGLPANSDDFDTKPFVLPVVPICLTMSQWHNNNNNNTNDTKPPSTQWWVDTTAAEQEAATGSLTLLVTPDGELHSVEFAGACNSTALTTQHLPLLHRLAVERAVEVQAILPTSVVQE